MIAFQGSKNLKEKAMKKAGLLEKERLVEYLKVGKGVMPGYEGKLSEGELDGVAEFTLTMAKRNWK